MTHIRLPDDYPSLDIRAFLTEFPAPLGDCEVPGSLRAFFASDASPPVHVKAPEGTKAAVRDLLRARGYKPTGRGKPASEYLHKAIEKGWFSPDKGINLAVDACNVASLHSGLPISVIDADLAPLPWAIAACPPGTEYVFNPSGQVIRVDHLLTLHDAEGPCAGPVKDSQRTKTHDATRRTLSVIWGTAALPGHAEATESWYRALLDATSANTTPVSLG